MLQKSWTETLKDFNFKHIIKFCEYCVEPIKLSNNRDLKRKRFCSQTCRHKSQVGRTLSGEIYKFIPTICLSCSTTFLSKNKRHKFCSTNCQYKTQYSNYRLTYESSLKDHLFRLRKRPNRNYSLEFLLNLYQKQKGLCAISKVPMTWTSYKGKILTNISIDRIDSSIGYEEDNTQLVCRIINIMKHDLKQEDFIKWCKTIAEVCYSE